MQTNNSKDCLYSIKSKYTFTAWFGIYVLFLPLFLYVLYVGFRRHRKHHSSSHSDVLTFHMVALELCNVVCAFLYCNGFYSGPSRLTEISGGAVSMFVVGQALFHCLTCLDRYMAVVQPIVYLSLRKKGGVAIRNVSIGCVWLFGLGHIYLTTVRAIKLVYRPVSAIMLASLPLTVTGFCSVSVICVLIRPGPGERGRDGRILDQSKRSALETVETILAVLLLRFLALFITNSLGLMKPFSEHICILIVSSLWFSLPSSLVLPLLFLRRAGKLTPRERP